MDAVTRRRGNRAQSEVLGVLLVFVLLLSLLSMYQVYAVPQQNKEIEFNSYLDASADMGALRDAILRTAAEGTVRGVTVQTGVRYPARVFPLNPPAPEGRVRSGDARTVSIANVAGAGRYENVGTYLDSEGNALSFTTRPLVFEPAYNEFSAQEVVVGTGLAYRDAETPVQLSAQTLVQGNRITIVSIAGELDAHGITSSLSVDPVSTHARTTTVTNAGAQPLTLTVPTTIPAARWESDILAGQLDPTGTDPDRYVTSVTDGSAPDTVDITLEAGAQYELRLARVEVHGRDAARDEPAPTARYLVTDTEQRLRTGADGRVRLAVEARDRYNNPVSDTLVTFTAPDGHFETADGTDLTMPIRTDDEGQAVVYYNATGFVGNFEVKAFLGTSEPAAAERKTSYLVTNTVTSSGSGVAGDSNINPGNYVLLDDAVEARVKDVFDEHRVRVTFRNVGQSDATITAMRFTFYFEDKGNERIIASTVFEEGGTTSLAELPIRSAFVDIPGPQVVPEGGTKTLDFSFDIIDQNGVVKNHQPDGAKEFFVIEVVYNDAFVATYFVSFEQ